jgi:hypothetical protein
MNQTAPNERASKKPISIEWAVGLFITVYIAGFSIYMRLNNDVLKLQSDTSANAINIQRQNGYQDKTNDKLDRILDALRDIDVKLERKQDKKPLP